MKKLLSLLLVFALLMTAASALAEDSLDRVKASGKLRIGMEGYWIPWTYRDEADVLTGFEVEVGKLIAAGLGVEPEFYEADFGALLAGVNSDRFDIICNGVDWTPERAESYTFSIPYIYTEVVLVVRGDNEDIHTVEDLAGRTTSNSPNSTYAQRAEKVGAGVTYVDSLVETLMMVEQGRVDATINAKGSVEEYLEQHPDANLKIVQVMPGDPVCSPVKLGSESLIEAVNAVLQAALDDGTLAALSEKYFGVNLTVKPE